MSKKTRFFILIGFFLISIFFISYITYNRILKNNSVKTSNQNDSPLGYYNINFNNIFTDKENYHDDDDIKSELNSYYNNVWIKKNLSGSILVARGNHILLEKYRGYSNIKEQIPIEKNTSLHVASVSKIITSLAILKLIEANKLKIDQKVNTILSSFPYPEITIKDLLTHRSGLPNYAYLGEDKKYWDKNNDMYNEDVLNLFANHKPDLQLKPNTRFIYCNTNFALLALIISKITKTTFPKAIDQMIFKPLGMNNSFVFEKKDLDKVALSYYPNQTPYAFNYLDFVYGDKNVYSTPEDLFRLSQAMFSPNFLAKDLLNLMFTPFSNEKAGVKNYGLGMRMMIFKNGKKIIYHNGWWHGSNSVFVHLPDEKVTIIAIGNKYSNSVYSAFKLASLFGDYPLHLETGSDDSQFYLKREKKQKLKEQLNTKDSSLANTNLETHMDGAM